MAQDPGDGDDGDSDAPLVPVARRRRRRSLRQDGTPRKRTLKVTREEVVMTRAALGAIAVDTDDLDAQRPKVYGDCTHPRPCPWVGCRHHLYLDVTIGGSITIHRPDLEPWELQDSCSIDVALRGGITLEEVGLRLNLTRERIRQVELSGLNKFARWRRRLGVDDE